MTILCPLSPSLRLSVWSWAVDRGYEGSGQRRRWWRRMYIPDIGGIARALAILTLLLRSDGLHRKGYKGLGGHEEEWNGGRPIKGPDIP